VISTANIQSGALVSRHCATHPLPRHHSSVQSQSTRRGRPRDPRMPTRNPNNSTPGDPARPPCLLPSVPTRVICAPPFSLSTHESLRVSPCSQCSIPLSRAPRRAEARKPAHRRTKATTAAHPKNADTAPGTGFTPSSAQRSRPNSACRSSSGP
jgi:hypothetical protein